MASFDLRIYTFFFKMADFSYCDTAYVPNLTSPPFPLTHHPPSFLNDKQIP